MRNLKWQVTGTVLIVVLLVLSLSLVYTQDSELQEQSFLLTFIPNIQFAPVYVSIANGYFEEIGLDLTLEYLNEPDVVDLVASGQASFGVVSGEQVILSAANGRSVVYVYEWFQEYPVGLIVDSEVEISSIEDLVGSRIGVPGRFGASYIGLTTLLITSGLSEEDIQIEEIGFNAPEVVCIGAIDASVIYVNNEPLQIRNRTQSDECDGVGEIQIIRVADIADLVSNGLLTSQSLVEEDPEFVRAFVDAFDRGVRDVIQNPARSYLLSREFIDNLPGSEVLFEELEIMADEQDNFLATDPNREAIAESRNELLESLSIIFDRDELVQLEVLLTTIELWDAELLGVTDLASWETMEQTLRVIDVLEDTVELDQIFTNDFVPAATQETE